MPTAEDEIVALSHRIAEAIAARDVAWLSGILAPDFVSRTPGGDGTGAAAFLQGIAGIPGEILSVSIEKVRVDVSEAGALATGVQTARVKVDGQEVDDRRAFVDWFVQGSGGWRLRAAVDFS